MIDGVAFLLAAVPTLLLAIFTAEVAFGLRPLADPPLADAAPRTTVLIPAHDEAAGITATVAALREADPGVDLLVVADNCTDDTATRARLAGARVAERVDPARRGKGYALAFGREVLAAAPPDCVVVLDADCAVGGAGVTALARAAMGSGRAVQARNLQRPDLTAPPTAQVSNFAFLVRNLVRQRGLVRLGGVAALTGTGMALPWEQFAAAPLANADLAEDISLSVWLTGAGTPPLALERVHVWSDAVSGKVLLTQRGRWERGSLSVARRLAAPLIVRGLLSSSRGQMWLGCHYVVPPLALLFAGSGVMLVVIATLALVGASPWAAVLLAAILIVAGLATVAAWIAEGRGRISGRTLLSVPFYIAMKVPLYRRLLGHRGAGDWVRTQRSDDADSP